MTVLSNIESNDISLPIFFYSSTKNTVFNNSAKTHFYNDESLFVGKNIVSINYRSWPSDDDYIGGSNHK